MMPTLTGHAWRHSAIDGQDHLFPTNAEPDDEGVITAACGKELMAFRVLAEDRSRYCLDCLVELGKEQADKVEKSRALALKRFRAGSA